MNNIYVLQFDELWLKIHSNNSLFRVLDGKKNTINLFIFCFVFSSELFSLTTRHNVRFWGCGCGHGGHWRQRFDLDHFLMCIWGWWWRTFLQWRGGKRRKATAAIWRIWNGKGHKRSKSSKSRKFSMTQIVNSPLLQSSNFKCQSISKLHK